MKQLLLRVPDDVHQRLSARARREQRSINSIATEILDATADVDLGSARDQIRARVAAAGLQAAVPTAGSTSAPAIADVRRQFESLRATADELIDIERGARSETP